MTEPEELKSGSGPVYRIVAFSVIAVAVVGYFVGLQSPMNPLAEESATPSSCDDWTLAGNSGAVCWFSVCESRTFGASPIGDAES